MFKKDEFIVHTKYEGDHKGVYRVLGSYDKYTIVDYHENFEIKFKTSHLRLATTEEIKAGKRL